MVQPSSERVKVEGEARRKRAELEREKIMERILVHSKWTTVQEYATKLAVLDFGIDGYKTLDDKISDKELQSVFTKREDKGWRLIPGDELTPAEIEQIRELYCKCYCMRAPNSLFSDVFLRAWLADQNGTMINWAKYAFSVNCAQMKRRTCKPPLQPGKTRSEASGLSLGSYEDDVEEEPTPLPTRQFSTEEIEGVKHLLQGVEEECVAGDPLCYQLELERKELQKQVMLAQGALADAGVARFIRKRSWLEL